MLRTFVDSAGNEWEAFDVIPRAEERRAYDRRNSGQGAVPADRERRESDRRLTVGGRSPQGNLNQGWLCFERGADRRRLTPIPENWQRCSDAELESLRESARSVRLNSTSLQQMSERDH